MVACLDSDLDLRLSLSFWLWHLALAIFDGMLAKTISSIRSLASMCCTMADHLDVIGTVTSSQLTSHLLDVNDSRRNSD